MPISERAIRTLLDHYNLALQTEDHIGLPSELGRQVTDDSTPPILRVELAHLLYKHTLIPDDLLDRMTDADQPGPVRLLAADILLKANPTDGSALRWATGRALSVGLEETPMMLDESLLGSMVFGPGGILPYEPPSSGPTSVPGVSPTNRWQARN